MKGQEKIIASYEEYRERIKWARETAKKFGIQLDRGEEHFMIPIRDANNKIIRTEMLSIRHDDIPLKTEIIDKKTVVTDDVNIEYAIEAIKRFPDLPFREAAHIIKKEKAEEKKGEESEELRRKEPVEKAKTGIEKIETGGA